MLLVLCLQVMVPGISAEPELDDHYIKMVQGDDPTTETVEADNELHAIERYFFKVPWNESWIKVPVPKGVNQNSWDIDHMVQVLYPDNTPGYVWGEFSTFYNFDNPPFKYFDDMEDMECCVANFVYWGFPAGANRNFTGSNRIDTDTDFIYYFDNINSGNIWNFSNSGLKMKPGNTTGNYTSIPLEFGVNITKVELAWNVSVHQENISFYVSNNNGTNWTDVTGLNGEEINFITQGNELKWKINMTQDIQLNNTPILNDLWINLTYTPNSNEIILQLTYVMEKNSDKFEFTMDLYNDYYSGVIPRTLIYVNKDHFLQSNDIDLKTYNRSQPEYPNKDVYYFMSGIFSPEATITIGEKEEKEEEQMPWLTILLLIILILITVIILVAWGGKKEAEESSEPQTEVQSEKMEKLKHKKLGLLKAIKKLDKDHNEGLLDDDIYKELRAGYKEKASDVIRQMDVIAASAAVNEVPEISPEKKALLDKKQKMLKSMKKLDNDFKEGTLDEDVYKELRDGYKKKAAEILKELEEL